MKPSRLSADPGGLDPNTGYGIVTVQAEYYCYPITEPRYQKQVCEWRFVSSKVYRHMHQKWQWAVLWGFIGAATPVLGATYFMEQVPVLIRAVGSLVGGFGSVPGGSVAATLAAIIPAAGSDKVFAAIVVPANAGAYAAGYLWYCEHKKRKDLLRKSRGL